MKPNNRVLINIIGVGYDVCLCEVSPDMKDTFAMALNQEKQSLHHLLFNEDFFNKYEIAKLDNTGNCKSWNDFENKGVFRGANLLERGQIEIWINRQRAKTYKFSELISAETLFPLFELDERSIFEPDCLNTQLVIGFQETGHLNKFRIKALKFLPEELRLHTVKFHSYNKPIKLLYKVTYLGVALKSLKRDTVVTGTVLEMIENTAF